MDQARDQPQPTPEGALIRRVRESLRPRVTVSAAARQVGISAEMWGHIERGHRSGGRGEERVPVVATASTLAHMAYEVGLTPTDLEEVGREDAAAILIEMRGPDPMVSSVEIDQGRVWFRVPPDLPDEDREAIRRWAEEWAERLDRTRQEGGGSVS